MSSDEDDYLSAKYLVDAPDDKPQRTYSQIRKDAQKKGQVKQEQNRIKSRRERELEAREAGLSKSLFERAKEEEEAGLGSGNKALSIMMKMGFKPGQSLGNAYRDEDSRDDDKKHKTKSTPGPSSSSEPVRARTPGFVSAGAAFDAPATTMDTAATDDETPKPHTTHMKVPLPLNEWAGKKGIGLGKRARSPSAPERLAKMAKMAEDAKDGDYRSRARDEYNNRRAEGRLGPAQRTCASLDEQAGKEFNVLWLNPQNENTFPPGLIDALTLHSDLLLGIIKPLRQGDPTFSAGPDGRVASEAQRLRWQMQADALQPLQDGAEDDDSAIGAQTKSSAVSGVDHYTSEILEEATQFLRLQAQDRLQLVLSYLRDRHSYCYWCGVKYDSAEDMEGECPGPDEDDHD